MASVLPAPYSASHSMASNNSHYGYVQPPPSPPADDSIKCSLPSISNLLGLADAGSPTSESSSHSGSPAPSSRTEARPASAQYSHPAKTMPPTPPMVSEPSFDSYHSHSRSHSYSHHKSQPVSSVSGSGYYYETTPPLEENRPLPRMQTAQPQAFSSAPVAPHYGASYSLPPFYAAAGAPSMPGMYYQRPLPQFPPMMNTPGANVWQHHHYISPASAAAFPQSQDRYICQTCNKAFSRPSSLRIHSHSHTGEKPFKCPHPGCGKAFSVRSNMKRHERGCHNYDSSAAPSRNSSPHA
ncbi:hypothetical protein TD95_000115 [Thielaviopsis punctulata]|uniref:C2H2-type domain-containing protein n=1 Tax=Thielaviopsis punctulata TaxID=72032 RepID=A0A0F4Z8J7_9PEZI|nr:hypothetical protein TD95_000115 [Thielaviopsis punctulata]